MTMLGCLRSTFLADGVVAPQAEELLAVIQADATASLCVFVHSTRVIHVRVKNTRPIIVAGRLSHHGAGQLVLPLCAQLLSMVSSTEVVDPLHLGVVDRGDLVMVIVVLGIEEVAIEPTSSVLHGESEPRVVGCCREAMPEEESIVEGQLGREE